MSDITQNKSTSVVLPKTSVRLLQLGEEIILLLLTTHEEKLCGTQMVDLSEGTLNKGSVYVFLARLEKNGYVTGKLEQTDQMILNKRRMPRRYFEITEKGKVQIDAHTMYRELLQKGELA